MKLFSQTQTGVGSSAIVPLDLYISPFNIGFGVVVSGTVTYTVQHTFDNVFASNYSISTGNWFNHPVVAGQTANADGNYAFPITAMRLTVTAGTGTATISAAQAGVAS